MFIKYPLTFALALVAEASLALQPFTVTREELTMMPPYCTALYGKFVGLPSPQDSPLRHTIPLGCPNVHYYCDGLKAMIRVNRHADKAESNYWLQQALHSFEGVSEKLKATAPNCSLRAEAYVNTGRAQLQQSSRRGTPAGRAAESFLRALELDPTYLDAYYVLSDFYVGVKNKKKALSIIEDGLRYHPESKGLLRRFKELGGTTPPAPIARTEVREVDQGQGNETAEIQPLPEPAKNEKDQIPTVTSEPTPIGTPNNPYCRFCPPD